MYDSITYDPVKTWLFESEAEWEEPTNHKAQNQALWLVYLSAFASNFNNVVFTVHVDCKQQSTTES